MVFSSNTTDYEVLEILSRGYCRTVCRCRERDSKSLQEYTLIRITKKDWFPDILKQAWEAEKQGGYPDLNEFFSKDSELFFVFFRWEGLSLGEYLKQKSPGLEEMTELAGEILRQMVLRQNSLFFLEDVLCTEQIGVTPGKKIHFRYLMKRAQEAGECRMEDICRCVDHLWTVFFASRLKSGSPKSLSVFSEWLKAGTAKTVLDIYREFWQIRIQGFGEDKNRRELLKENVKNQLTRRRTLIRRGLLILLWLCIGAALFSLGCFWKGTFQVHPEAGTGMEFIGDIRFAE